MNTLVIKDLTIEYASGGYVVRPIDGLNLSINSGELVLLLGASGCGKTTLLSALAGILTPTSGTITFGDLDVTGLSGSPLTQYRQRTVGIVFQAFNLVPSLTALENVAVPLLAARLRGRSAREQARALLSRVSLDDRAHHRPGDLSGGQQQRVAIARALAHDPALVLADEPTAHLDYVQVEGILRLLRELAGPGRIVVVSTHDERLLPLADRIVELSPRVHDESREPARTELAPGEVLFSQGEAGALVYVVEEGAMELVRELAGGGEETVSVVHAGQYFGELAPMFGLRRSATARADGAAAVTGFTLRDFRAKFGKAAVELISASREIA